MKALTLIDSSTFEVQDVPLPEIGAQDVLIRIHAVGICGSDIHGMDGSSGRRQPPIVMGHEAAGVVEAIGAEVTRCAVGDRVTVDSTVYCGACDNCAKGQVNLCASRQVLGVSCDDYHRDGAFAEFLAAPERIIYALPDSVSFEHAAMVEPLAIAIHAVRRVGSVDGKRVAVIGAGMIGQLILQVLKAKGASEIIAVDLAREKLELATQCGSTEVYLGNEIDAVSQPADVVFEVVGLTPTVRSAIQLCRLGGEVVLVGNLSADVDLPLQKVVTGEISLHGSCACAGEYPECLELIASQGVNLDLLVSGTAPLVEGADWFQRLYQAEKGLMKVILKP